MYKSQLRLLHLYISHVNCILVVTNPIQSNPIQSSQAKPSHIQSSENLCFYKVNITENGISETLSKCNISPRPVFDIDSEFEVRISIFCLCQCYGLICCIQGWFRIANFSTVDLTGPSVRQSNPIQSNPIQSNPMQPSQIQSSENLCFYKHFALRDDFCKCGTCRHTLEIWSRESIS